MKADENVKILNLGSCCIDHVYHVPHFSQPGETLPCTSYEVHPGGKGLNQSLAIARAGAAVHHAGKVGKDGLWMKALLDEDSVETSRLLVADEPSGHAIIQVNPQGENSIVLFGGTNRMITVDEITSAIDSCAAGDFLVLQNEISHLDRAMQRAIERELRIVFNAAPMTAEVTDLPLADLDLLLVNEIEGEAISGAGEPDTVLATLARQFPSVNIVLTLGEAGAQFMGPAGQFSVAAPAVQAVDTTGAGDTFTGYFVAEYSKGTEIEAALTIACTAAAVSVTRAGAASSIPARSELAIAPIR